MHDHLKFQETQEEAELKVDCQQEEMTKTAAMQSPMSSEEPQRCDSAPWVSYRKPNREMPLDVVLHRPKKSKYKSY